MYNYKDNPNDNVLNRSVNDTYKHNANFDSTSNKLQVIEELKTCNYRTPTKKIAFLLEKLLDRGETQSGHWLYIAQNYTARVINRVLYQMIKLHRSGAVTIENPAAYFTFLIKFRKKRKKYLTNTNHARKQQTE